MEGHCARGLYRPSSDLQAGGLDHAGRSVAERERLRQHLICIGLLEIAGVAYTFAYFEHGLPWFGAITVACMALGAMSPFAALRGDLATSAHLVSGSVFAVVVTTSYASGGVTQAGYAWIYIVPLVAGLLGGVRCLALWGPLALVATLTMCFDGIGPFRVTMSLPDTFASWQSVFDVTLISVTVLLIVGTFLRTRTLAERETQAMVADLARAEVEARQADQAKSVFLATMSHEIRTPMNGVLGMTDLLLEMPLGEQQRRFAELIKSSGESLLSILNDILDYSKIEAGRMEIDAATFDVRTLIEQTVELIAARGQEQRLAFVVDLDPAVPAAVIGDAGRLRQVLMNLLGNAVKFTTKGDIEVSLSLLKRTADSARVTIAVRDTGVGIAPDALERLFKPFSQADSSIARQFGGTGLGLAISAPDRRADGRRALRPVDTGRGQHLHRVALAGVSRHAAGRPPGRWPGAACCWSIPTIAAARPWRGSSGGSAPTRGPARMRRARRWRFARPGRRVRSTSRSSSATPAATTIWRGPRRSPARTRRCASSCSWSGAGSSPRTCCSACGSRRSRRCPCRRRRSSRRSKAGGVRSPSMPSPRWRRPSRRRSC